MKLLKMLGIILVFLMSVSVMNAIAYGDRPPREEGMHRYIERIREEWGDPWDDEAGEIAEDDDMFGRIIYDPSTGYVQGRYIEFILNEEDDAIEKYTVNDILVFEKIYFYNSPVLKWVFVRGTKLIYVAIGLIETNYSSMNDVPPIGGYIRIVVAHDNPNGVLRIAYLGFEFYDKVFYVLSNEMNSTVVNENLIKIIGNNMTAHLISRAASMHLDGNIIEVKMGGRKFSYSIFISHPMHDETIKKVWEKIFNGIANGKLAGHIRISVSEDKYAVDSANYSHEIRMRVKSAERNRIRVSIGGYAQGGRAVFIETNKESLDGNIKVRVDGKEAKAVSLNMAISGGVESCYAVVEGKQTVGVIVWIPSFSEHEVEVTAEKNPLTQILLGVPLYGWIIITVVIVAVTFSIIIIKKRK